MDEIMFYMLDEESAQARLAPPPADDAGPRKAPSPESTESSLPASLPAPKGSDAAPADAPPSSTPATRPDATKVDKPKTAVAALADAPAGETPKGDAAKADGPSPVRRKPKSKDDTEDPLQKLRDILSDQKVLAALLHLLNK